MASYTTVNDIYQIVCWTLLEDTGLSLGLVSQQQFLDLFSVVLFDFINKTGLVWEIFTQQILLGQSQYTAPPEMNQIKHCFVGGTWINHLSLQDLDSWAYGWKSLNDAPLFWHEDGLPPKTVELAPNPNYTGTPYSASVVSTTASTTSGNPTITVTSATGIGLGQSVLGSGIPSGTIVLLLNGNLITLSQNVTATASNVPVTFQSVPPVGVYGQFNPADGNITMVGPQGPTTNLFTTASTIPIVPDALCYGIAYGVMARIFSMDGEVKDEMKAAYCQARYIETVNIAAAISGQVLEGE